MYQLISPGTDVGPSVGRRRAFGYESVSQLPQRVHHLFLLLPSCSFLFSPHSLGALVAPAAILCRGLQT